MNDDTVMNNSFVKQRLCDNSPEKILPWYFEKWQNAKPELKECMDVISLLKEHGLEEDSRCAIYRALEFFPAMPSLRTLLKTSTPNGKHADISPSMSDQEMLVRLATAQRFVPDLNSFLHIHNVVLWTGTLCNYRCWHCHNAQNSWKKSDMKKSLLDFPVIERRFNAILQLMQRIERLTGYVYKKSNICFSIVSAGEVMLHPQFADIVDMVTEHGFTFNTTTNASLLSGKNMAAILRANRPFLSVSLDAHSPELYSRFRKGGSLPRVHANLHRFIQEVSSRGKGSLTVTFCRTRWNSHEIPDFIRYWAGKVSSLTIQKYLEVEGEDPVYEVLPVTERQPCSALSGVFEIREDGVFISCKCGHATLGNVDTEPLERMFLSEERIKLFAAHGNKQYEQLPEYCLSCLYWGALQSSDSGLLLVDKQPFHCHRYGGSTVVAAPVPLQAGQTYWALNDDGVYPPVPMMETRELPL